MTYRGAVIDLDGTIYRGTEALPGAREAITTLRERGVSLLFFSNNPTKTPAEYVDRLADLGIDARPEEIVSAASVTTSYLAREHDDDRLFVVGSSGLYAQLEDAGLVLTDEVGAADVLVASYDRTFDYDRLTEALWVLDGGAAFVGTDPDVTVPQGDGPMVPGSGAIIGAIAGVAGRDPEIVVGKPSTEAIETAIDALDVPPEECLVIGDRLHTDIELGTRAGMTTALVLTGVTSRATLADAEPTPDYVLESIGEVESILPSDP